MVKYRNIKMVVDGIKFDSKAESLYYLKLKLEKERNLIKDFALQPKFVLQEAYKHPITHKRVAAVTFAADFLVTHNDGTETIIDVKGQDTVPNHVRLKQKMFEKRYNKCITYARLKNKQWTYKN